MPNLPAGPRRLVSVLLTATARRVRASRRAAAAAKRPAAHLVRDRLAGTTIRSQAHRLSRRGFTGRALSPGLSLDRLASRRRAGVRRGTAPLTVAALVLVALITSAVPATGTRPSDAGALFGPRLAVGGGVPDEGEPSTRTPIEPSVRASAAPVDGAYLNDGTFFKPVAVDTSLPASKVSLTVYTVRSGDTLYQIASRHHLSFATMMWANGLTGTLLHVGQVLRLPPIDGTIVTVGPDDTLDSIAATAGVEATTIADYNGLTDGRLILGQVLMVPGGTGPAIKFATPTLAPAPRASPRPSVVASCTTCGFRPLLWPVPGGEISQPFGCTGFWAEPPFGSCAHFHGGIDIWAPIGTPVLAAAAGTVTFAGWKNDGGGYQAWVSDGNGYTTDYHHLSAVLVVTGQHVGRGQLIGRVGATGSVTGSHLHFEIWIGPAWTGGYRVNPMLYF